MIQDQPCKGRLGFGCAYLVGGFERHQNIGLVHAALDAGIRHFDTAPMYGNGTSEAVLGEALMGLRSEVTITTKVGIGRPVFTARTQLIRFMASPIRRHLPKLSRVGVARTPGEFKQQTDFRPEIVRQSLEDSLRFLRTDYIDNLLLHEVEVEQISDELLGLLENLKKQGKILQIGVGSSTEATVAIDKLFPFDFLIYQRSWSILRNDEALFSEKYNVFHRAILGALDKLRIQLNCDGEFAKVASERIDCNLSSNDELAKILIGASIHANPNGTTLFASRRINRVVDYSRDVVKPHYASSGAELLALYRSMVKV